MSVKWLVLACLAASVAGLTAQSTTPTFEVASVKRKTSTGFVFGSSEVRPGGVVVSTHATLVDVIRFAYDLPAYRLSGGPPWARSDYFDVEGRAGRDASPAELKAMLQALLAERFQLVVHHEQREMPIYTLTLARSDKQVGPQLRRAAAGCDLPGNRGAATEEQVLPSGAVTRRRTCSAITALISYLSGTLQSPVDDQTALEGLWDYELSFLNEARRRNGAAASGPGDPPALSTALQEQLGLRLDAARGPVDVLVIESAVQPTEN